MDLFTDPESPLEAVKVKHRFTPDELGKAMRKKFVENAQGIAFDDWFEGYDFPQLTAFNLNHGRVLVVAAATTPERVRDATNFLSSRPDWVGEKWLVTYWNLLNSDALDDELGLLEPDAGLRLREKNHAQQRRPSLPKDVLSRLVNHTVQEHEQLQQRIDNFSVTVDGEKIDGIQEFYKRISDRQRQIERGQNERALREKIARRIQDVKGELKQALKAVVDSPVETPDAVRESLQDPGSFDLSQFRTLVDGFLDAVRALRKRKEEELKKQNVQKHVKRALDRFEEVLDR